MESNYVIEENWIEVKEPQLDYLSDSVNSITYKIIGVCYDVYNELGRGFSEVIYKDAIEYEFKTRGINFDREKQYKIKYKDVFLPRNYNADFVVEECVILEIKAQQGVIEDHFKQVINYLAVSKNSVGLLINFGEPSLKYKRIVLTK